MEAMQLAHRAELNKLEMQLALYRQTLVEHGIQPPDKSGEELLQMWRDCSQVIWTANEFVGSLRSSKELIEVAWK